MHEGLQALSEREKDTLRLLLGGHDAKSIARRLDLSVHTVNERLRDTRRKLGVSSSREAARLLAEAEQHSPNSLADKQMGVGAAAASVQPNEPPYRRRTAGVPLAWLGGGMLIMSLLIAAVALSSAFHDNAGAPARIVPAALASPAASDPSDAASRRAALEWATLVDGQHWVASWDAAGTLFKAGMPKDRWASVIQPVRQPLGAASSRVLQTSTRTTSLPNAPAGEYAVLQYRTSFAGKPEAVETIILARESGGWKVAGYFIR